MTQKKVYLGDVLRHTSKAEVTGEYVTINDESYYKIANYDHMENFFISVVSDSDHWMYISTRGGLSAGRVDSENALFPYYTDDKITDGSPEERQALLEAPSLATRRETLVTLMEFALRGDGGSNRETVQ